MNNKLCFVEYPKRRASNGEMRDICRMPIKTIIFDFGGVFLNLNFALTEKAFEELGVTNFGTMFTQHHSNDLFIQLETGRISPPAFYEAFREETHTNLTNEQIRDAWNALLLDLPQERILWLNRVREHYQVYLFSNTNQVHYDKFMADFRNHNNGKDFNSYFQKAYYSHEMGLRKPDAASFQAIIDAEQLDPALTLFIDDTAKNLEGARQVGLQTYHLVAPQTVLDLELW